MKIQVRKKGRISILDISGKITLGEGETLVQEKVKELLDTGNRSFILNMIQVPYVDSIGLGGTFECKKIVHERNGVLKIIMTPDQKTYQVFVASFLDKEFEIFGDEEEALASFKE